MDDVDARISVLQEGLHLWLAEATQEETASIVLSQCMYARYTKGGLWVLERQFTFCHGDPPFIDDPEGVALFV